MKCDTRLPGYMRHKNKDNEAPVDGMASAATTKPEPLLSVQPSPEFKLLRCRNVMQSKVFSCDRQWSGTNHLLLLDALR